MTNVPHFTSPAPDPTLKLTRLDPLTTARARRQ